MKCVYHECENTSDSISMFRFPVKDRGRLERWIRNSGNKKLESLSNEKLRRRYVCAAHFLPSAISKGPVKSRLVGPAIPIHFQCANVGEGSIQKESSDADKEHDAEIGPSEAVPDYRCDRCDEPIQGFRYTCVQCADWDLCAACEARAAHDTHYVLRVPGQRPYKEVQAILSAIRDEILRKNIFLPQTTASVKEEIKEEITNDAEVPDCTQPMELDPLGAWDFAEGDCVDLEDSPEEREDGRPPRKRRRSSLDSLDNTQNLPTPEDSSCGKITVINDDLRVPALFDSLSDDDRSDSEFEYIEIIDVDKLTKNHHQTKKDSEQNNNDTIKNTKENCIPLPMGTHETLKDGISDKCSIKKPIRTYTNTSRRLKERKEIQGKEMGTDDKGIETNNEGIGTLNKTMIRTYSKKIETDSGETGRHSRETGKDTKAKLAYSERAGTLSKTIIGTDISEIGTHKGSETDTKGIGAQSEETRTHNEGIERHRTVTNAIGIGVHSEGIHRQSKGSETDTKGIEEQSEETRTHNEGTERHSEGTVTNAIGKEAHSERNNKTIGTKSGGIRTLIKANTDNEPTIRYRVRLPPGQSSRWRDIIVTMLKSQVTVQLEDVMRRKEVRKRTEIN